MRPRKEPVCSGVQTATFGRLPEASQSMTRGAVQTTAFGRGALSTSTARAGLSMMRRWRTAALSAARSVAWMRWSVTGPIGRGVVAALATMASYAVRI
ncbi:hypothetical protein [Streptomyces prunicolor]|uniref:hypothetical protein n=1 Tax=Streptomyces prunicolor TaxID=67348 RepID=UPI0034383498